MRRLLLALPLVLLLAAPAAFAGGWATVGMSSTPAGVEPGKPWNVELTILQHGRTPLVGVHPSLTISRGDARETFAASETSRPGVYRAAVTFPTAGTWSYEVDDGFISGRPHTFAPVRIGAPATPVTPAGEGGPSLAWLLGGLGLLAAAAGLLVLSRRPRRHHPQAA